MNLGYKELISEIESQASTDKSLQAVKERISQLTMPPRAMGKALDLVEELTFAAGKIPTLENTHVFLFAAEHGVTVEGVSAFPAEVTQQMIHNFIQGGAAINQLSKSNAAGLSVVNVATAGDYPEHPQLVDSPVAKGSNNLLHEAALDDKAMLAAIDLGAELAIKKIDEGVDLMACGEMGIGNTTVSACLTKVLTDCAIDKAVGRGTGVDDATLMLKCQVVQKAIARVPAATATEALDILKQWGGYEFAAIVGVILACAARRVPFILDGYNVTAAAAIAAKLCPRTKEVMIASHKGAEPGHEILLKHLNKQAYLEWGLRLGEGSGAVLLFPLCKASCDMVRGMATFEEAAVSDK